MRILKNVMWPSLRPNRGKATALVRLETEAVLDGGNVDGVKIRMGDTHHPALSETDGDYDGQFVFINDKANARVAVIDLRDFETKQIVKNPNLISNHGSTFVTPEHRLCGRGHPVRHAIGLGICADQRVSKRSTAV
jgi:nitrous-oxide reductase